MSNPSRPVTIRDLATVSGLSIATILLALRKHPRISSKTRERVYELARELGYRANPMMAAHWATVRARQDPVFQAVIAVINDWETVPKMQTYPWLATVYAAMEQRANALGYILEEFSVAGADHKARRANLAATLRVLKARGIYAITPFFPPIPAFTPIRSPSLTVLPASSSAPNTNTSSMRCATSVISPSTAQTPITTRTC